MNRSNRPDQKFRDKKSSDKKDPAGGSGRGGSSRFSRPPQRQEPPKEVFVVEGLAAICEYVRHKPDCLLQVWVVENAEKEARERLSGYGVTPKLAPVRDLEDRPGRRSPVWAEVRLVPKSDAELGASGRTKDVIVALDHVEDPRNLGAIVRTAAFFGVREILVPEKRQVLLTDASVNTSQGGFALADLFICVNLGRALETLKEQGWWIVGADMDGEPFEKVAGFYDKTVLVLGAEETGISQGIRAKCDRVVSIPGIPGGLESLNVAVAGGILVSSFASVIRNP
jgi:tRNA G18 (ribose-2'-O)-methylase SpoU